MDKRINVIKNTKEETFERYQTLFMRIIRKKYINDDSISQFINSITNELSARDIYFLCYEMRRNVSIF